MALCLKLRLDPYWILKSISTSYTGQRFSDTISIFSRSVGIGSILVYITEKEPCGRVGKMAAKIHQCCFSLLHPYTCSIQFYPIWHVPSALDITLVHWPTFSSCQDSLQDSFGVRLLHRQNTMGYCYKTTDRTRYSITDKICLVNQ